MSEPITICDCGHAPTPREYTTGYGTLDGKTYCFPCCAKRERQQMIDTGKATLYLTMRGGYSQWYLSDWPGGLRFQVKHFQVSDHNMAGKRYDVWFTGPDGYLWRGYQVGDNTQICHCKRTKEFTGKVSPDYGLVKEAANEQAH